MSGLGLPRRDAGSAASSSSPRSGSMDWSGGREIQGYSCGGHLFTSTGWLEESERAAESENESELLSVDP